VTTGPDCTMSTRSEADKERAVAKRRPRRERIIMEDMPDMMLADDGDDERDVELEMRLRRGTTAE
jgi:hypothetical protein